MTRWAWLRVALLGLVAAEAAGLTTGGPRWRAAAEPGASQLTFAADGATCYALAGRGDATVVLTWDARTGAGRTTRLDLSPGGSRQRLVKFAAGGRVVVVCDSVAAAPDSLPAGQRDVTHVWRLFDPATGALVAGPFAGMPGLFAHTSSADYWRQYLFACALPKVPDLFGDDVSADGRWLLCRRSSAVEVIAVPAATVALRIAARPAESVAGVAFAEDAPRVLILWQAGTDAGFYRPHAAEVVELPSGRVVRRLALPPSPSRWSRGSLRSDRLVLIEQPNFGAAVAATFDLRPDSPTAGHGVTLVLPPNGFHDLQQGADWLAVLTLVRSPPVPPAVARARAWLGPRIGTDDGEIGTVQVAVFDAAARPRSRLATGLPMAVVVAPDGRTVAATDAAGRVALWDVDPPSPWPRAVVAGLLAAVGAAAWEQWRASRMYRPIPRPTL